MGNCMANSTPSKVLVLGASGYVGKATLASLVERHGSQVDIYAGVRDPTKFEAMNGVTVVKADMGDTDSLTQLLQQYNFERVFIVTPGHQDRTKLVLNAVEACQASASVKFVLFLSVPTVDTKTIFGEQCKPIEQAAKKSSFKGGFTTVRLPLFIDNHFAHVKDIKEKNTFFDPRNPYKLHTPVAVSDVGKAAADILAKPRKHYGRTYTLVMPPFSLMDLCRAWSKALGKQVLVTTVSYERAKEDFMALGFPEWQANGVMELYKSIDEGKPATQFKRLGDIEKITSSKAMTMEEWVAKNAAAFK